MSIAHHTIHRAKLRRSGMGGLHVDMPPRWGLKWLLDGVGYKHVAPLGLALAHPPPGEILRNLGRLEAGIQQGMKELERMLK